MSSPKQNSIASTTGSLGRRANLSSERIRTLIKEGKITAFLDETGRALILEQEAQRFLAERAAQGPPHRGGRRKKAATP